MPALESIRPGDFGPPRVIVSASDIPVIGFRETPSAPRAIQLIRTSTTNEGFLLRQGAFQTPSGWYRHRTEDFPFERLNHFLPRYARSSVVVDVVDLIPATSWFASLANMLVKSSWDSLRDPLIAHNRGCEDCGAWSNLEAHELWSYDYDRGVQTLKAIVVLCRWCHETRHLGRARAVGRFPAVFKRLVGINRIRPDEESAFEREIFDKWTERSEYEWQLDLRGLPVGAELFLQSSISYEGDGWIRRPARSNSDEILIRLINVGIVADARNVTLVGLNDDDIEAAEEMEALGSSFVPLDTSDSPYA